MTRIIPRELIKHLEWSPGQQAPPTANPVAPASPVQQEIFSIDHLVNNGNPFYSEAKYSDDKYNGVPVSLQEALEYATNDGVVASMPYLIAGKAQAEKSNYLWQNWFTALTEENVGIDKKGTFASRGNPVVVVLHGGGILTPDRINQAYSEGLTDQNAAQYTEQEMNDILDGKLPTGESIQLYHVDDVKNARIPEPFGRYGVVLDFETAKATDSGYHQKTQFMENPLVIARAGTLDHLDAYFEKAKHDSDQDVNNSHRFGSIDPTQPQGRVLFLNYYCIGLSGSNNLDNNSRFVGVAPEAHRAR